MFHYSLRLIQLLLLLYQELRNTSLISFLFFPGAKLSCNTICNAFFENIAVPKTDSSKGKRKRKRNLFAVAGCDHSLISCFEKEFLRSCSGRGLHVAATKEKI
jgi:hypothetical protein